MSSPGYKVEGLGERIKKCRLEHGMTQEELAGKLGIGRSSMATYERGAEAPPYGRLIRIANELGVSTDYLLGYDMDNQLDLSGIDEGNKENVIKLVDMLKEGSV